MNTNKENVKQAELVKSKCLRHLRHRDKRFKKIERDRNSLDAITRAWAFDLWYGGIVSSG